MALDPVVLLAGPRGRRLCLELARELLDDTQEGDQLRQVLFYAALELDPGRGTSRVLFGLGAERSSQPNHSAEDVARLLAVVPLSEPDERAVLRALAAAVDTALYWQEPSGEDVLAAAPELHAPLARVATLLANSPHSAWWAAPLARDEQWVVDFLETPAGPAAQGTIAEILERWHTAQVDEEDDASRNRPADLGAAWSGTWWSKPPNGVTRTTRGLGLSGPVGLRLVEDGMGWKKAAVHRIHIPRDARVYEIGSPQSWAELCRRYPLEVTASRRHNWYRTTACTGRWVIPDWAQVGQHIDAIHLTVAGYLATAGRAVPVNGDLMTVLAGWDPDQTNWLSEITQDESTHQAWRNDGDEGWTLSIAR